MEEFDEAAFKARYEELNTQKNGLGWEQILSLLTQFQFDQYPASVQKAVKRFYHHSKRNEDLLIDEQEEDNDQEQEKQGEENQKQPQPEEDPQYYRLSFDEALKFAYFLRNKTSFQLWKFGVDLIIQRNEIIKLDRRKFFPPKDKGHRVNLRVVVGQHLQKYKSYIKVRAERGVATQSGETEGGQQYWVKISLKTSSLQESQALGKFWAALYEFICQMVEGQVPDGADFLKTIDVKVQQLQNSLVIRIQSNNTWLNQLLKIISDFGDKVFRSELRFLIEAMLEFNFDFSDLILLPSSSVYDIFTQNCRINFKYRGSQFLSALKELMIKGGAFNDLSVVNDDNFTLSLIGLVSTHECDLNLSFDSVPASQAERESLQMVLSQLASFKGMLKQLEESQPDIGKMINGVFKNKTTIQAKLSSIKLTVEVELRGLDRLFEEVKEQMGGDNDD